ncbi:MAG: DUF2062 domain-containing protein [Thermodesulfobacteriota bacterium]
MAMLLKPHRAARYYYLKLLRLQGDPETLARGVAIGVFVGITPTLPFHTVLTLLFAYLLGGNSIAALIAAAVVSNPVTMVPQYYLCWKIGNWFLPGRLSWQKIQHLMAVVHCDLGFSESLRSLGRLGTEAMTVLLLGGIILAVPATLIAYPLSRRLFATIRRKRRQKHILD